MWGWSNDTAMYLWMALGSIFWGTLVVGIIFFLSRALTRRTKRRLARESESQQPVATGVTRGDEGGEISEEELKRIRELLAR